MKNTLSQRIQNKNYFIIAEIGNNHGGNILKAKKKISWQPKVSFQKGLSRTIKSYLYDRK